MRFTYVYNAACLRFNKYIPFLTCILSLSSERTTSSSRVPLLLNQFYSPCISKDDTSETKRANSNLYRM